MNTLVFALLPSAPTIALPSNVKCKCVDRIAFEEFNPNSFNHDTWNEERRR